MHPVSIVWPGGYMYGPIGYPSRAYMAMRVKRTAVLTRGRQGKGVTLISLDSFSQSHISSHPDDLLVYFYRIWTGKQPPPPPEKSNLPDYLPVAQGSPYASSEPFRCASRLRSLNASYAATPPYAPRLSLALADHSGGKGAVVPCIDFIKQSKISTLISQRGRY